MRRIVARWRRRQSGVALLLAAVVVIVLGFAAWVAGSPTGAEFALRTGIRLAGSGEVSGVQGSLASGLRLERLRFYHDAIDIEADDLVVSIDWEALRARRLHVPELSVQRLEIDLRDTGEDTPPEEKPEGPITWPELPLALEVDRLAVGAFGLARAGEPVPVRVADLDAQVAVGADGAKLDITSLRVITPEAEAGFKGTATVTAAAPLGVTVALAIDARQGKRDAALSLGVEGNLDDLRVALQGKGVGMEVEARSELSPLSRTLPLRTLTLRLKGFDPSAWVPDAPPALLNLSADVALSGALRLPSEDAAARDAVFVGPPERGAKPPAVAPATAASGAAPAAIQTPAPAADPLDIVRDLVARVSLTLDAGSRWQQQPLQGKIQAELADLRASGLQADVRVGRNTIKLSGALGGEGDKLDFRLDVPQPAALWPGLTGSGTASGSVGGTVLRHRLDLTAKVNLPTPAQAAAPSDDDLPALLTRGPVDLAVKLDGGWGPGAARQVSPGLEGWRGTVSQLNVRNPHVGAVLGKPVAVSFVPAARPPQWQWDVGATQLALSLPKGRRITLDHAGSRGGGTRWQSAGGVTGLVPAWLVAQLPTVPQPLRLGMTWDLSMAEALGGTVQVVRRDGDIAVPGEPPVPLGLKDLQLDVRATAGPGSSSRIAIAAQVAGSRVGSIKATGGTTVAIRDGIPVLDPQQAVQLDASFDMDDLAWLGTFTGDSIDIGGKLKGTVQLARDGGAWQTRGQIDGSGLRVVRIDDGVRLLDGTLSAHLMDDRIVIDSLRFPSAVRTRPGDSRIRAWLASPEGQGGSVEASGEWRLSDAAGRATITLSRFPLVQRADRFIAGSGKIDITATPKSLDIEGRVVADAGWVSLEGASDLPSLDRDVVIVRAGEKASESAALGLGLNLDIDLGKQFYLQGMGLDTGLTGTITIRNTPRGMRATGMVRTRGGQFEAYGQKLAVRKGVVTFQGLLDDPLLDIVAVRTGLRIEAGVQVGGTAQRPEITLVSFPEVSEVEKLSWLLLGRGPDATGADAGMLLSAAASLLGGGGEPVYRQLGLDELGLRSGTSTGVRGLLPDRTVAGDVTSLDSEVSSQFLVAGKRLSDSLYVTFEQALTGRETIVRTSYRLARGLTAAVQVGSLNGLQLVWSLVFDD